MTSRLPRPQHVFIINEAVWQEVDGQVIYRGLQPKGRPDVIVLTPHARDDTVPHEILHTLGFKEVSASVLGKISAWRYQVLKRHPLLKSIMEKPVSYEKCHGCSEFARAHEYGGRVEHYKLRY
jgi:hypothetical protein